MCLLVFVNVRRSKGGLATFRKRDGHSRKDGFPDLRCVHVGRVPVTDVPAQVRCHCVDTEPRRLRLKSQDNLNQLLPRELNRDCKVRLAYEKEKAAFLEGRRRRQGGPSPSQGGAAHGHKQGSGRAQKKEIERINSEKRSADAACRARKERQ